MIKNGGLLLAFAKFEKKRIRHRASSDLLYIDVP